MDRCESGKSNFPQRCIILIPARSGSKGIVDKNIKSFNGRPLLYWSMDAAEYIADIAKNVTIVVSSDSSRYLKIAKRYPTSRLGQYKFHLRSKASSDDEASMVQVADEVLNQYCEKGMEEEYVFILLQPTSPIRSKADLKRVYSEVVEKNISTVLATRAGLALDDLFLRHPKYRDTQSVTKNLGLEKVERRQERVSELLNLDGAFYGFPLFLNGVPQNIERCFRFPENIVVSELGRNIEIDVPVDFVIARALHKYYVRSQEYSLIGY